MPFNSKKDLETMLGDPKKAIASMALPMVVSYIVSEVNLFVDTFWTSGLGSQASSAISTVAPMYTIFTAFGVGLGVAASATISYRIGKGEMDKAGVLAGNTIALGLLVSVFVSLAVLLLMDPIIDFMDAGDVRELGKEYIFPYVLFSWTLITHSIIAGLLRAEGGGRRSMLVLITSAFVNMALDPVLIYGLDLGLTGAALSTALSALAACVLGLSWYRGGKMTIQLTRGSFKLTKDNVLEIFAVAIPRTMESLINSVIIIVQRVFVIACIGTIGVMYFNMPWRFVSLCTVPAQAIGAAMIPVCSSALGQGRPDKMVAGMKYAVKLVVIISALLSVLLMLFPDVFISAYTYSESMVEHKGMLSWVLFMDGFLLIPYALTSLGSAMLQAMKRSKIATGVMFIWAFVKLAMMYVASLYSFEAIIYALVISHYVVFAMMYLFVHKEIKTVVGKNSS